MTPAMGAVIGGGLGALGNVIGGWFGSKGQASANAANLQIAREQMAFQERMSGTAYQRAAKDLKAAGLNRVLALGNSASTPPGASATMQNEGAAKQAAAIQIGNIASATALNYATAHLKTKQAEALGIPASIGEGGGDVIDELKTGAKTMIPWMIKGIGHLKNEGMKFLEKLKTQTTSSAKQPKISAMEMLEMNYAEQNMVRPKDRARVTVDMVRKNLDLNTKNMTDEQIAQYIIDNPARVERMLKRWRMQNLN